MLEVFFYPSKGVFAEDTKAAGTTSKNTKTQASTEVFDVQEKDLPVAATPAASGKDIPPPDFKDMEDDKLINNLLGDDAKKTAPTNTTVTENNKLPNQPPAFVPPTSPEQNAITTQPAKVESTTGGVDPIGANTAPAAIPPAAIAETKQPEQVVPSTNTPQTQQDAAGSAVAGPNLTTPAVSLDAQVTPQIQGAQAPVVGQASEPIGATNSLSDDPTKLAYEELRKHLKKFIATANVAKTQVADSNKQPEPSSTAKTQAPAVDASNSSSNANGTQPQGDSQKPGNMSADSIDDLLDTNKKPQDVSLEKPATPAPGANSSNASPQIPAPPVATVAPSDAFANNQVSSVAAPAITNPAAQITPPTNPVPNPTFPQVPATPPVAAAPAQNINSDKITQLPAMEPKEVIIDESSAEKIKPKQNFSEADKAYFKLLEKERNNLSDEKKLSDASRGVIDGFASELAPVKKTGKQEPTYLKIEHGNTGKPGIEEDGIKRSQNNMNISIRKADKNEDNEKTKVKSEKAYKALLVGQISAAISIYKDILDKEPSNKEAMFGLATAYHKNSQFDQARAIYTNLLKSEPGNKQALNNFLVLVAEEAPEDALIELQKLERINSDFSPIPAQIGMINLKLGNTETAARSLRRAILLSPDNISYQYNLAVTYDKMAKIEEAVQLYHKVAEAVQAGAIIPGPVDKLVERMTYLEGKIAAKK